VPLFADGVARYRDGRRCSWLARKLKEESEVWTYGINGKTGLGIVGAAKMALNGVRVARRSNASVCGRHYAAPGAQTCTAAWRTPAACAAHTLLHHTLAAWR